MYTVEYKIWGVHCAIILIANCNERLRSGGGGGGVYMKYVYCNIQDKEVSQMTISIKIYN